MPGSMLGRTVEGGFIYMTRRGIPSLLAGKVSVALCLLCRKWPDSRFGI